MITQFGQKLLRSSTKQSTCMQYRYKNATKHYGHFRGEHSPIYSNDYNVKVSKAIGQGMYTACMAGDNAYQEHV